MWWCFLTFIVIPPLPGGGRGYTVLPLSVRPSFLPSVRSRYFSSHFLSNYRWQKSDIWSQASYRHAISWEAFLDPSDSLLIFIHIEHICSYFVAFFSANIDGRNLIFRHKLHIGTPFCGKRFFDPSDSYFLFADLVGFYTHLTYMHIFRHIFLSNYWWHESDIWSQASYWYSISWEAFLDPSDSYFLFAEEQGYHKWALAHSSSCFTLLKYYIVYIKQIKTY
jgi:hypothetical protein